MTTATGQALDYTWVVEQGELVTLRVPVLDSAGAPFLVDGWSVDAKVKDRPGGTVLYTWPAQDIAVSGNNVDLTIPPAVSLGWTFRNGRYRVKVIHPSDPTQVHRILQGRFVLELD